MTIPTLPLTKNLAIATRSRVSSAHTGSNSNLKGGVLTEAKFFMGKETYGTPVVETAATSMNFTEGILFHGEKSMEHRCWRPLRGSWVRSHKFYGARAFAGKKHM